MYYLKFRRGECRAGGVDTHQPMHIIHLLAPKFVIELDKRGNAGKMPGDL